MAAPLPQGSSLQVMPQAPRIQDPRLYAADPRAALATAQAGLHLGSELANLENMRSHRELEAAQIKAASAKNAYDMKAIEQATLLLPKEIGARVSKALADTKANENALALATARGERNFPQEEVNLEGQQIDVNKQRLTNALESEKADIELSKVPSNQRAMKGAQGAAYGAAMGNLLISPEGGESSMLPAGSVEQIRQKKVEDAAGVSDWSQINEVGDNGEEVSYRARLNRDGTTYAQTEKWVSRLPSGAKSAGQLARDTGELIQLRAVGDALDKALIEYEKSGDATAIQSFASLAASTPATSTFSLAKKMVGQWAQTKNTKEMVAEIQNFSNAVGHGLFGSALSATESRRLDQAIPVASDLANPESLRAKLKATMAFFDEKIESAKAQGVVGPTGKPLSVRSEAIDRQAKLKNDAPPAASAPPAQPQTLSVRLGSAPPGTVKQLDGKNYVRVVRNGVLGWLEQP